MTTVWIVEGAQGEYEDYRSWVAGVFEAEADALEWVTRAEVAFEVLFTKLYETRQEYYKAWDKAANVNRAPELEDRISEIVAEIKAVDGRATDYYDAPRYSITEYQVVGRS